MVQLTRVTSERRLYALNGVGTLRLTSWTARAATAEAGGRSWQLNYHSLPQPIAHAADPAGTIVGEFKARRLHRDGVLRWSGRQLALRSDTVAQERYILIQSERKLAVIEGRGWDKRPMKITVIDAADLDPGLLLFAAFVVGTLTQHSHTAVTTAG